MSVFLCRFCEKLIGNKDDCASYSENGELAAKILDEYMKEFQQRNPTLRVFSAHLHIDEATSHLHVDFVPYITESKRGVDIRVSLKQALGSLGFKGGSRGDTELNQWINAENNLRWLWSGMALNGSRKEPMKNIYQF